MDTADSLNKMLEEKLAEAEKEIIKDKEKVLKQLNIRDCQFYIDKLKLNSDKAESFIYYFTKSLNIYKKVGQFDYDQPHCTIDHIHLSIHKEKYSDWIYIGKVKEGFDDIPHGVGIRVWNNGVIDEGYWKDGKLHGRGRTIFTNGDYYTGEWKEGRFYGQGTWYAVTGDKYTGKWDGNRKGQGEINYTYGAKYTGQWEYCSIYGDLARHGLGTLYSADRQVVIKGMWLLNEYVEEE